MFMYIVIGIIVLLLFGGMSMFNKFVKLKNQCQEAWSGIDVQLKRRYDLVPNIINTVKGYAKHEQETFEKVIQLRNSAQSVPSNDVGQQAQAEKAFGAALGGIFALAENYPELKANENFKQLQNTLTEVEDNIQNARRYYNAVVRDNNTYVESFPSMIVAQIGGFQSQDFFEIDHREAENVKVEF